MKHWSVWRTRSGRGLEIYPDLTAAPRIIQIKTEFTEARSVSWICNINADLIFKLDSSNSGSNPSIPVLDSPRTPPTPNIEDDITIQGSPSAESELEDIPNVDLEYFLKEKGPRDYRGSRVVIPRSID